MVRILVVDADPLYRDMAQEVLERSGHCVHAVETGREAQSLEGFDLVVIDLSGTVSLASVARPGTGQPRVIGLVQPGRGSGGGQGMAAVVAKPFSAEQLLGAVGQVLHDISVHSRRSDDVH